MCLQPNADHLPGPPPTSARPCVSDSPPPLHPGAPSVRSFVPIATRRDPLLELVDQVTGTGTPRRRRGGRDDRASVRASTYESRSCCGFIAPAVFPTPLVTRVVCRGASSLGFALDQPTAPLEVQLPHLVRLQRTLLRRIQSSVRSIPPSDFDERPGAPNCSGVRSCSDAYSGSKPLRGPFAQFLLAFMPYDPTLTPAPAPTPITSMAPARSSCPLPPTRGQTTCPSAPSSPPGTSFPAIALGAMAAALVVKAAFKGE